MRWLVLLLALALAGCALGSAAPETPAEHSDTPATAPSPTPQVARRAWPTRPRSSTLAISSTQSPATAAEASVDHASPPDETMPDPALPQPDGQPTPDRSPSADARSETPTPATSTPSPTAAPEPSATPTSSPTATPRAPAPTPTAKPTPPPTATRTPRPTSTPTGGGCDPSYPTVCIAPPPPKLNCKDVPHRRFQVLPPDPHGFDRDKDGIGCES